MHLWLQIEIVKEFSISNKLRLRISWSNSGKGPFQPIFPHVLGRKQKLFVDFLTTFYSSYKEISNTKNNENNCKTDYFAITNYFSCTG
ncbi:hypothetical protein NEIRO03_0176 [Nematocida sp. AWRm78]|nr:hypothetical protein NEIRO02_0176 [Nematocida sp. AWRm79]KAI5182512.1 hypothetical protein NEIRO03_0176 [Nematocida sp. AWRm78]